LVGDGGVLTTVQDMALWERNFLEPRLGRDPQKLIDRLVTPGRLNDGGSIAYGLGLGVAEYRGLPTIYHSGGIPGYRNYMMRLPQQQVSVLVLCNQGGLPAVELGQAIVDLYLDGQFKSAKVAPARQSGKAADPRQKLTLAPAALAQFAGVFHSEELDAEHVVTVDGEGLSIAVGATSRVHCMAAADRFECDGMSIVFRRDSAGTVSGYALSTQRLQGLEFEREAPGKGVKASR
jgi:hypothetical protein